MTMQENKKPAARVGHRKSRTGCFKCRSRRVKCDETSPICANCQRLGLQCQYPNTSRSAMKLMEATSISSPKVNKASILDKTNASTPTSTNLSTPGSTPLTSEGPEYEKDIPSVSRGSRMELRLLHAFMCRAIPAETNIAASSEWLCIWFKEMPRMAFDHNNLLYALLAFSATQLLGSSPNDSELSLAQAEYFELALQHQRAVISNPNSDVEAKSLAAVIIAQTAFGMLRGRALENYTPPVGWFEVSRGAWRVSPDLKDIPPNSTVWGPIVHTTAPIWTKWARDAATYAAHVDEVYAPILTHLIPEEFNCYGGDARAGLEAYRKTLALLTNFREAVAGGGPIRDNIWRVCLIAQAVPDDFVRFIRQERPRALLITASIFAIISRTGILRIFGDVESTIPRTEIYAIQKVLPEEWQELMIQPLRELSSSDG